jgi:hypothetical protein
LPTKAPATAEPLHTSQRRIYDPRHAESRSYDRRSEPHHRRILNSIRNEIRAGARELNPNETKVLATVAKPNRAKHYAALRISPDWQGAPIRTGFTARSALEPGPDGRDHLVARAMNWRAELKGPVVSTDDLAQRILNGLAQAGVHRALVDLNNWTLLKRLDEPCPFYDWRVSEADRPRVHPDDEHLMASMTKEFADGATSRVLRLPGNDTEWVPVHVTVNRVELEPDTYAGLISVPLPTDEELAEAGLPKPGDDTT